MTILQVINDTHEEIRFVADRQRGVESVDEEVLSEFEDFLMGMAYSVKMRVIDLVNAKDENGKTTLDVAVEENDVKMAKLLILKGANLGNVIEIARSQDNQPMIEMLGRAAVIRGRMKHMQDMMSQDNIERMQIVVDTTKKNLEEFELLMIGICDNGESVMSSAASFSSRVQEFCGAQSRELAIQVSGERKGYFLEIEEAFQWGDATTLRAVYAKKEAECRSPKDFTNLCYTANEVIAKAVQSNRVDLVEALAWQSFPISNHNWERLMMNAISTDNVEMFNLCIARRFVGKLNDEQGVLRSFEDHNYWIANARSYHTIEMSNISADSVSTAPENFIQRREYKIPTAEELQNGCAEIMNSPFLENGSTPLHYAAKHGSLRILQFLLEAGVNVDAMDMVGNTPLHNAAGKGDYRAVRILMGADANSIAINNKNETPLHLALTGLPNLIQPNAEDIKKVVPLLLQNRNSLWIQDQNGHTPFYVACERVHDTDVKEMLRLDEPLKLSSVQKLKIMEENKGKE